MIRTQFSDYNTLQNEVINMSGGQITIKKHFENHKINNDKMINTQVAFNILEEISNLNNNLSINYITSCIYQFIHEFLLENYDYNQDEFYNNFNTIKNLLTSVLSLINEKFEGITLELDTILCIKSIIHKLTTTISESSNGFAKNTEIYRGDKRNFPQHLAYQMNNVNFVIKNIEQYFGIKNLEQDKTQIKKDNVKNYFARKNIQNCKFSIETLIDFDKKIIERKNNAFTKIEIAILLQKLKNDLLNNQLFLRIHSQLGFLHDNINDIINQKLHLLSPKETKSLHSFFNNMHKSSLVTILEEEDFNKILGNNFALINHFKSETDEICRNIYKLKQTTDFQRKIDCILILTIIHAYMQKNNIDNTDLLQIDDVKNYYLYDIRNKNSKNYKIQDLISTIRTDNGINFLTVAIFLHGLNYTLDDYHDNMSLFKLKGLKNIYNKILDYSNDIESREKFIKINKLISSIVDFELYSHFKKEEYNCSITQDDLLCLLRLTQVPTYKNRCAFLQENHFKFYEINKELFKTEPSRTETISLTKLPALYATVLDQYANINTKIIFNHNTYEIINNIFILWKNFDNAYIIEQEMYKSILGPLFKKNLSREDFKNEITKILSKNDNIFPSSTYSSISIDFKRQIYQYALKIYLRSFDFADIQNKQRGKTSYAPFFGVFEISIPFENIIKTLAEYHKELIKDLNGNQKTYDKYNEALKILESQYNSNVQIINHKRAAYNKCLEAYQLLESQYGNTKITDKTNNNLINTYNNYKLALNSLLKQAYTTNDYIGQMSDNPARYNQCFKTFMQSNIQYNNKENLRQASIKLHLLRIWESIITQYMPHAAAPAPIFFYRRAVKPDTRKSIQNKQTLDAFALDKSKSMMKVFTTINTTAISDETNVVAKVKNKPKLHNT